MAQPALLQAIFVLFLLLQLDLSYVEIGTLMAYEKILTGVNHPHHPGIRPPSQLLPE